MTTAKLERTRNGNPRLQRTDDVLAYWAERITLVAPERESFQCSSMICESDSLYHYGRHFELARIIRDKRGRTRLVLLNGDSYEGGRGFGPSTGSRQRDTRSAVARTGAASVVVPFSALDGAGIDFDSIHPIHVRDDRVTIEEHSSRTRPTPKLATMPDPLGAMRTERQWDYRAHPPARREVEVPVRVDDPNQTRPFGSQHGWCEEGAHRGEDGTWRWQVRRHWLGDCIFRARLTERRTRKAPAEALAVDAAHRAWEAEHSRLSRERDRLGRIAFRHDTARRRFGNDYGAMLRAMFHAQGFREASERVAEEIRVHYGTRVYSNGVRNGRMPTTVTRWATYLSSFDHQEPRPLYFLCELPYGAKPNTVDEAVETLKPPEVVAALSRGLAVIRQGDLFAIPTKLTKRQIRRMASKRTNFEKRLRVLGTNHSVTEGIVLKGGAVLGRGVMRHEPEGWRPPDHKSVKLGDNWHLLVRNTVPRTR